MDVFDALPLPVRRALASACIPFLPTIAAKMLARGISAERAAELIREVDQRLVRKRIAGV
jgi:hypothetical protein